MVSHTDALTHKKKPRNRQKFSVFLNNSEVKNASIKRWYFSSSGRHLLFMLSYTIIEKRDVLSKKLSYENYPGTLLFEGLRREATFRNS